MRAVARLTVAAVSFMAVASLALSAGSGAHAQPTVTIEVGDAWFCQPGDSACMTTDSNDVDVVTDIDVGDTVAWDWVGTLPHTTTACSGSDFATCGVSQGWDSGIQASGTFSLTFTEAGTFFYRCQIHPSQMRGIITVLAVEPSPLPQPSPTPTPTLAATPSPTATPVATPLPSPAESPQATPDVLAEAVAPAPVDIRPAAVPAGGGEPLDNGATPAPWWPTIAAGGLLVAAAAVLVLRGLRG